MNDDEADFLVALARAETQAGARKLLLAYSIDGDPDWITQSIAMLHAAGIAVPMALRVAEKRAKQLQPSRRRRRPPKTWQIVEAIWSSRAARQAAEFTRRRPLTRTEWGALQRALVLPRPQKKGPSGPPALRLELGNLRYILTTWMRGERRRRYREPAIGFRARRRIS